VKLLYCIAYKNSRKLIVTIHGKTPNEKGFLNRDIIAAYRLVSAFEKLADVACCKSML